MLHTSISLFSTQSFFVSRMLAITCRCRGSYKRQVYRATRFLALHSEQKLDSNFRDVWGVLERVMQKTFQARAPGVKASFLQGPAYASEAENGFLSAPLILNGWGQLTTILAALLAARPLNPQNYSTRVVDRNIYSEGDRRKHHGGGGTGPLRQTYGEALRDCTNRPLH